MRSTRPEDLPSLGALFSDRFGHGLSPEEWTWKYRAIPGEGRSLVAEISGEVVAHAGALCLPARWRGGEAGIWTLVDFAGTTRRRGLRPALVELGRQLLADLPRKGDAPWIFGFPSERHFRLGERTFGYRPLTTAEIFGGEIPEAAVPQGVRIETGDSAGDWAEALWESCGVLGVRRSAAFLNWRYWARPNRYYRFYRLFSGEMEGFAVFSFLGEETWAAELWLPSGAEWYPSLLAVAADLRATGLKRWRFWALPDSRLGLSFTGERQFIGCRGREGGEDPVAAAAGFTYSMGDWDFT
ncbi:MAG TPA: hypothetical protein VJ725_22905 [Thermoanaerobaculia bacterium]|nr:hypothetical protein [Thermoanaerobaculia bacterium]